MPKTTITYRVEWSDGRRPDEYDTYAEALASLLAHVVGHPGDLSDGGDRTLVWESEADAAGDDGRNAVADIVRVQP